MPRSRWRSSSRSRICAWMVTSSAVVGSSAISSLRLAGDRHGDHHPLAHAARELVREGAEPVARRGMPTISSSSTARSRAGLAAQASWWRSASVIWKPTVKQGFERAHRLLEDHRHVLADQLAPPARAEAEERARPAKSSRSAVIVAVQGRRPIIASIATDLPEPLSPTMPTISPGSTSRSTPSTARSGPTPWGTRRRGSGSRAALRPCGQLRFSFGIEGVAQAVAHEVDGEHGDQDGEAGEGDHPPGAQDELARVGQHGAPFGRRRLGAQAEEAQRRGVEDGVGEAQGGLHDERRQAVGQDGLEHQPQRAGAGDPAGGDVVLGELGDDRGAGQPGELRQVARPRRRSSR